MMRHFAPLVLTLSLFAPAFADPVLVPELPDHTNSQASNRQTSITIHSVRVEEKAGQAWAVVQVRNNTSRIARNGLVTVLSDRFPSSVSFSNLAPGAAIILRIPTPYRIGEIADLDVGITMDPAFEAVGEVWDHVWHRVSARYDNGSLADVTENTDKR